MKKNNVLVLLSTYNGEKYLKDLLDSVLNQKNVNVNILIRDDGSTDSTINILNEYCEKNKNIEYYCDKNIGYAQSFWNLLKKAEKYDYYAFCDQDDIWLENKLYEAVKKIEETKRIDEEAILYTSNVICVNNDIKELKIKSFEGGILNTYEAFQKSILPGCTFVFNYNAMSCLKEYTGFMESHDWATYAIISVFGRVIYDEKKYIYYRIHENNAIGKKNYLKDIVVKVKRFFKRSKCTRSKFAFDFYNCYYEKIPSEYFESIKKLAFYKDGLKNQIKLLFDKNFKGVIFKFYVCLKRI